MFFVSKNAYETLNTNTYEYIWVQENKLDP